MVPVAAGYLIGSSFVDRGDIHAPPNVTTRRIGDALGTLFHRDNSSPPPEAFLFVRVAAIGFFGVLLGRLLVAPLWLRQRRRLG